MIPPEMKISRAQPVNLIGEETGSDILLSKLSSAFISAIMLRQVKVYYPR